MLPERCPDKSGIGVRIRRNSHSDISTTQIYVTLANIDVENAMNGFKEII